MRTALIFGVTGQDGSYLSEFLLGKDYKVVGVYRRSSVDTTERLHGVLDNPNFELMCGDVADSGSVYSIIDELRPDECYNLAAQSHVGVSFQQPQATFLINAVGPLNILEAIRCRSPKTRFYQASTSEMFGRQLYRRRRVKIPRRTDGACSSLTVCCCKGSCTQFSAYLPRVLWSARYMWNPIQPRK